MDRPRVSLGFTVINTLMLWITIGLASTALWPIYESWHLAVVVGGSLLAGSAVAIIGAVYRLSGPIVMLAAIGVYVLIGVPLAVPDSAVAGVFPSLHGVGELLAGTALGWKQLVTITLPVGTFEALLVPALVLVFFGTVIAVSVALRSRFSEVAAVVPPIIFVTAVAFGPATTGWPYPLAIALLLSTLVWLIWIRWYRRRTSIRLLVAGSDRRGARTADAGATRLGFRSTVGATLTLAVAASVGSAAVSLLPVTAERHVVRTAIEKPFDPHDYPSPLSGFRAYHQDETADAVMFTVTGLPDDARIRIATLDSYDGVVYTVGSELTGSDSGSFVRVPRSFDQSGVAGQRVRVEVAIDQYSGIWMPTVGKLESVTFAGDDAAVLRGSMFYNDNSGTAAIVDGLSGGDRYRLDAVVPTVPNSSQLATLDPGSALVPRPEPLPEELALKLSGYVSGALTPAERLQAMLTGLRAEGFISHGLADDEPASRSGHAADRITQLLTDQRMIGDAEQYAVTAALMASELGFPSRVVFGFAPEAAQASGDNGSVAVRGSDVSAWLEVDTTRFGWVALDPNPEPRPIPEEIPEETTQVARHQSPVQPPPTEPDFTTDQIRPDSTQEDAPVTDPLLAALLLIAQVAGWTLLVVTVVLLPFTVVVLAKALRRGRRRRAATALDRVSGGWKEFEDAVLDHGYSPPPSPTRTEVAATVGGTRALVLASVADHAIFSPDVTDVEGAEKVWRAVDELRGALAESRTRRQRIKALISLRSLGGYSVKSLFTR